MHGRDKEKVALFRERLRMLISQIVPEGETVESKLDGLAEKWNPLYDNVGRQNLVEDVNALARDFLRPIRGSLQSKPPDSKRIQALAEQLSVSESLRKIAKRDVLKRYVALYFLKCLEEM